MDWGHAVYFDQSRNVFAVEAGTRLGDLYETLFRGYGVTLPAGLASLVNSVVPAARLVL